MIWGQESGSLLEYKHYLSSSLSSANEASHTTEGTSFQQNCHIQQIEIPDKIGTLLQKYYSVCFKFKFNWAASILSGTCIPEATD